MEKAFISYLNDDNEKREGFYEIVDTNGWKISFIVGSNIITVPLTRILKIKEKIKEEDRG